MKKIIIPILIVLSSALLVSCGNKDEVAEDLIHYNNEEWVPINEMKKKEMHGIPFELTELENEGKEGEAIALVKDEILPIVDEVLEQLEASEPEHQKVKKLNDMQIEAEQFVKDKFKQVIIYYEGGDVSEQDIDQYDEEMRVKYQDILDYRDELIDKYNLEYVDDDETLGNFRNLKRAED